MWVTWLLDNDGQLSFSSTQSAPESSQIAHTPQLFALGGALINT
jgi:hypothetical protein